MSNEEVKKIDLNTYWEDSKFESERFAFLWKLSDIANDPGYLGSNECHLCGYDMPSGTYNCLSFKIPMSYLHFVECHGHKPSDMEIELVNTIYISRRLQESMRIKIYQMEKSLRK